MHKKYALGSDKKIIPVFLFAFLLLIQTVTFGGYQTVHAESIIPEWVKSNAGWWSNDQISETEFLAAIQHLIKEEIILIPPTTSDSASDSSKMPSWIKINAGWWADELIPDDAFTKGIQYLIQVNIIVIPIEDSFYLQDSDVLSQIQ